MRKTLITWAFLLGCIGLGAQNYHMKVFNNAFLLYDKEVNTVENFHFDDSHMFIHDADGGITLNIRDIDSITFPWQEAPSDDTVYITYNGSSVDVINPFSDYGVYISINGANVDIQSYRENVPYVVSGSSNNGRLIYYSAAPFHLILNNLSLSNTSSAAIGMGIIVPVTLTLKGTSTLADGANGSQKEQWI